MHTGEMLLDRFEIQQRVGAGGMGEVFRAKDHTSGETVAVKVLIDGGGQLVARFVQEAQLLAELSHPGIVRYVAHGKTKAGKHFLVMEWLEGEDLKERLERAPLTIREAVTLVARVAEALGAAHARGVVHRDLKPSNLFLPGGRPEQVKVLDFGIARREGMTNLTQAGMLLGTLGYMAPEQASSSEVIDARADVFALGCVLYLCLTGEQAFVGDYVVAILAKILLGEAPRVRELCPDAPEALDTLVAQMLAKEPELRPSDGAAVAAALSALGPIPEGMTGTRRAGGVKTSITVSERRLLSVVLLSSSRSDGALDGAALRRAVTPYGGRLEKLADGSTIVILADEELVATDQAVQTARCALDMRELAPRQPMAAAMGRMEVTGKLPEGDALDRAARMLTPHPGASVEVQPIAIDEVMAGLLDARFEVVESATGLMLHGERELGPTARTLLGKPTACVGRDFEIRSLEVMLTECIDDSVVRGMLIIAPAGLGKSRLAAELMVRVRRRDEEIAIWVGRSDSLRAGSTLDLLRQALRGALGIQEGAPLEIRRDKLRARVAEHVPEDDRKRVTEFLGELVDTWFPEEDSAPLRAARQDAQLMSEQLRKAWIDFLRAETSAHPILLVLEDLHWGDLATVRFIDAALRDLGDRPCMVLALARPEVHDLFPKLWAERSNLVEIRLKELTKKASERLVRQVLGDEVSADTMQRLVKQADGNAFYLEELIRAVAEGKGEVLPETVLAMVEARLSRLDGEARRALRAASIFGEACWEHGVSSLLGGEVRTTFVGEWIERLVEQELLMPRATSRFPGERELSFRHALLREGAYAMLTDDDRKVGHRVAGEWLERHGEADPMVLAGHFERGGEAARAGGFYLRAAEQANRSGDAVVAVARARLGLACEGPPAQRVALLGLLSESLSWAPQTMMAALPYAEEAMRLSSRGSIPWAQGAFATIIGSLTSGRVEEFLAMLTVLQGTEPALEAAGLWALALVAGTSVLDLLGRARDGDAVMDRLGAVIASFNGQASLALTWWNAEATTRDASAKEDPWSAFECATAGLALAESQNHVHLSYGIRVFHGMNLWFLGAPLEAERLMEGMTMVDAGTATSSSFRRFSLAWLRADRGALEEARLIAAELRDFGHANHAPLDEGRGRWALAEVLRRAGDSEGAEREIEAAIALFGVVSALDHPGALATLGALRLSQGRAAEALAAASDALSRHEAMGVACGMFRGAFVRLTYAEALQATGAHEAARATIAKARARLLTIADKIGSPDYRKSFLENVPENARTLALARAWLGEASPSAQ